MKFRVMIVDQSIDVEDVETEEEAIEYVKKSVLEDMIELDLIAWKDD